jgi:hypothetical protein
MRARFLARLNEEAEPCRVDDKIGFRGQVIWGKVNAQNGKGNRQEEKVEGPGEGLVFQRVVPARTEKKEKTEARQYVWAPVAVAAAVLVGVGGFYLGDRTYVRTSEPIVKVTTPVAPNAVQTNSVVEPDRVHELGREKAALVSQLGALKGQLSASDVEQQELSERLAEANEKLALLQRAQQPKSQGTGDTSASLKASSEQEMQVALLQKEVARLRTEFDESIFKITAQQHENDELRSKLQTAEANLQQELSLKDAKSQMGELVAARNLHIVDVYDADTSGKRQKAFGRVFYTEGKSLVFYAYDLEGAGQVKANVVFHVWGGRAGVKEVTRNLGILHKDDDGQSRWKMTFDDPSVLSQINSVFVTAESANKNYAEPHGKKVLFAYFGSQPNHP